MNIKIKEYFDLEPCKRDFSTVGLYVTCVNDIIEILEWSCKHGIKDSYEDSIKLLCYSQPNELLLETLESNQVSNEEELEVLILSIAFCSSLSPERKLQSISELIPVQKTRLIRTAIIDALYGMYDSLEPTLLINKLNWYLINDIKDDYIKDYVEEAIKDLQRL